MPVRIDLHTHSDHSDGVLTAAALVARAASREVHLLALTDHDTISGCDEARSACEQQGITFLAGVELTCEWRGREIHVVGLNVDTGHAGLREHCDAVRAQRRDRVVRIGQRLSAAGLPGEALTQQALCAPSPTRMHIARALYAAGLVTSPQRAFERWLKRGQAGYVTQQWSDVAGVVRQIMQAGGIAVLAHPHRYQVSNGVQRELVGEFREAGGAGIEVSVAGMAPADTDRAATLARRFDLAGSVGSDFHDPDLPWRPLGRQDKLPEGVRPLTAHLGLAHGRSET
jgi:3',5'-nucleoside bisphosphate phosphatase